MKVFSNSLLAMRLPFQDDVVYQIQILKRRKENPDMDRGTSVINRYYVSSQTELSKKWDRIVKDCETHNARAYLTLIGRKNKSIYYQMLRLLSDYGEQGDYKCARVAFDKAFGHKRTSQHKPKYWVIDVDSKERTDLEAVDAYITDNGIEVLGEYKTPNGHHYVVSPFNKMEFRKNFDHDIKESMILYYVEK